VCVFVNESDKLFLMENPSFHFIYFHFHKFDLHYYFICAHNKHLSAVHVWNERSHTHNLCMKAFFSYYRRLCVPLYANYALFCVHSFNKRLLLPSCIIIFILCVCVLISFFNKCEVNKCADQLAIKQ
jgi:hypothetical protein